MSNKLYTEEQVQALIAAAYLDMEACYADADKYADSIGAVAREIKAKNLERAKSKLREMLMEVAKKLNSHHMAGFDNPDDYNGKVIESIVNEVFGETS